LHFQDERSRVAKFTPWRDVALYPTQVYSIASQLLIFGLMLRLASAGAGAAFIAGMYCILNGLTRFVEEHYRGEPQTARVGGLHSYQWMAAAMVAAGCVLCVIPSKPLPESGPPAFAVAALIGVLYAAAMGVEFPRLSGRFTRLS
jgi:phosphatidylglycerol:prolipoprotein diacylglycerol transferase